MRVFKALFAVNGLILMFAVALFSSDWSPFQNDGLIFTIPLVFYLSLWSYISSAPSPQEPSKPRRADSDAGMREVLATCVGMPVIVLWADDRIRVGFVTEVCDRSPHLSPSLIVRDYLTGQTIDTLFGAVYLYDQARLRTFFKLSLRERNCFSPLAYGMLCTTRPYASKGREPLTYETANSLLEVTGFHREYEAWSQDQNREYLQ